MKRASFVVRQVFRKAAGEFGSLGHNVGTYVIYGVLYDIMFNLYKPYAAKFVERLGGEELHISLVTSLPGFFAVVALIPFSVLLAKIDDKRKATALLFAVSRFFLVIMALTPLLPPENRAWAFVIALSVMNLPDAVSQASLQSFLGDLFAPRERAGAIAVRSKFGNLATAFALIISCLVLNFAASSNEQKLEVYQAFYVIAFLVGVCEIGVFMRLKPGDSKHDTPEFHFRRGFSKILKDRRFAVYCAVLSVFHFAYFMAFPLGNIVFIKRLGADELWVGLSTIASVVSIVASSKFWGRRLVKKGTAWVLGMSATGLSLNCLFIALAPNPFVYVLSALFSGWFTCGVNLGVLNGLLEATPDTDRVVYIGVFQTFVNLTLALAPLFSHYISARVSVDAALGAAGIARILSGILIYAVYRRRVAV